MGATVKISVKDWPMYLFQLGERAHKAAERGILAGAHRCIEVVQHRADEAPAASANGQAGAFNTGNYRRRWRVAAIPRGARLYNDSGYGSVIDGGRRAGGGMPPLRDIERWARRRLGLAPAEAKRAAYPIAKAIQRRGLRPRRVMAGALHEMTRLVAAETQRELIAELRRR